MRRALAILIFAFTAVLTLVATFGVPDDTASPGRNMIEVQPGEYVDFAVSPEMEQVQLVSVVPVNSEVATDMPQDRTYALDISWINPRGEIRKQARIWERSRTSRWPTKSGLQRAAELVDVQYTASDPRTTAIPVANVLPGGGTLRVEARQEGPILLMRSFGAGKDRDDVGQPPRPEQARIARRVGVSPIDLLEPTERAMALRKPWRSLPYSGLVRESLRRVRSTVPKLSEREQGVGGSVLGPSQALAVVVHGPVTVRISGDDGVNALTVEGVADAPEDSPPVELHITDAQPVALGGSTVAIDVAVPDGLHAITLRNQTQRAIEPLLISLPEGRPAHLAADTPAVRLSEFVPRATDEHLLTGPDRVRLATWRIGASMSDAPIAWEVRPGHPQMHLDVRTELADGQDERPRHIFVEDLNGNGDIVQSRRVRLISEPAPYERRAEDGGWVTEPTTVDHTPVPTARLVRVRADERMRVTAYVDGPFKDGLADPVQQPHLMLRYQRQARKARHRIEPVNTAELVELGQAHTVLANVRIEPRPERQDTGERHYVVLKPVNGSGTERTWLTPGSGTGDRAWCPVRSGSNPSSIGWDATARRLRSRELYGYLQVGSNEHLGMPWYVKLDGRQWKDGLVQQRMIPVRSVQEPAHRTAQLDGPPGSVLWLSTRGQGCSNPHRALDAWPMREGDELVFIIHDTWDGRRLRVGGVSTDNVDVDVVLEGMTGSDSLTGVGGMYKQSTTLEAQDIPAQMLRRPDSMSRMLTAQAFPLHTRAPRIILRVRHRGGPQLWLRAVIESQTPQGWQPVRAARLRGGQ